MHNLAFVPSPVILPLIADPEADIGAVLIAVLLFALPVVLTMIAYALKAVPIGIVQSAGDHILAAEKRVASSLAHKVESAIRPFTILVTSPVLRLDRLVVVIEDAFNRTRAKLDDIKRGTIPHYFHSALSWTSARLSELKADYLHRITLNTNRIYHYYDLARAHTDHYFHAAISHADAVGHDAEHYAHVNDTILRNEIGHYYNLAIQHADDDLAQAMHRADVVKVAAEAFATGKVNVAVHYLEDVISHRLAPVKAEADITKKTLTTFLDDCGEDLCNGLHGLSKELPKLFDLVEGVAFLGFVEEMIREPERTARLTDDALSPLLDGTVSLFRDLVGV